ncbi:larval cuticle protein 65Ag1-like [Scaptodrosophila lebanonensis]|uniref:Larval cuticle protein 65Ag1-like n=1 Tax=Drosophila lebanonensis TaxID=7225 RepID=A0A6J2UFB5_DROLE|nr:larval cuticle protein 65Ag1-like [Scaptodrosophila lebanonensis]
MKFIIVFAALFAAALAAPNQDAEILRYENDNIGVEGYNFALETSDGTSKQEQGQLKSLPEGDAIVVRGSFQYLDNEGQVHTTSYIADENGYQPQSADIPVA